MPSPEKANLLMEAVEDRLALDPVLVDLRGKTLMADFFLVCSGNSDVHIRAISDAVLEKCAETRLPKPRIEGQEVGEWVLLDFGDVVLHVMSEEQRERYRLEEFWSKPRTGDDAPPRPGLVLDEGDTDEDEDGEDGDEGNADADLDALEMSDDELDDAAFFEEADTEVEPVDEDAVEDGQFDDFDEETNPPPPPPAATPRNGMSAESGGGGATAGGSGG